MTMVRCKNCDAWRPTQNNEVGHCYLNPPNAALIPQQGIGGQGLAVVSYRPETRPDDGCTKGLEAQMKLV